MPERVARRSRGSHAAHRHVEVNHQAQNLSRAHRGLAEDRADVEHAESAHLEEVAQQRRAAALDVSGRSAAARPRRRRPGHVRARSIPAPARSSRSRFPGDQHADLEHVEEHAMQRGDLAQLLLHEGAQHVDQVLAGLGRGEDRGTERSAAATRSAGGVRPSPTSRQTVSALTMCCAVLARASGSSFSKYSTSRGPAPGRAAGG